VSLVLSWENPPDMLSLSVRDVKLWRTLIPGTIPTLVDGDVAWGMAVDHENSDLQAEYEIQYLSATGSLQYRWPDYDIERWIRPEKSCLIRWELVRSDGRPDANRIIEITDRQKIGNFSVTLTTNHEGKAIFVANYGARLTYFMEGEVYELDVCAPSVRDVNWKELQKYGTQSIHDHRAWF